MYTLPALGVLSFLFCMVLTPICRTLAIRYRLVDIPDRERKLHGRPIPRIGGVPIVLSYVGALLIVFTIARHNGSTHVQHVHVLRSLLPAAALIFLTGLLDDLLGLKPWQKVVGQLVGAGIVVGSGTVLALGNMHGVHARIWASPWLNIPLSIVWLIGCSNAVNLIDGLDGLATGVGLFATVTTLLVGVFTGNNGLVLATLPLAAALLAFLCYNFNPASIFLGDSGSLTIGFLLGCFALIWNQQTRTGFGMAAPVMVLALPLVDVVLAICRRYLRHVPIFSGDRGHIHHMILARGFKPHQAALILYGVCALSASLALLQSFSHSYVRGAVVIAFLALLWAGVHYLDYIELGAARRVLTHQRVLRIVRDEIFLHELERSISLCKDVDACWQIIQNACWNMGFTGIRLQMEGSYFERLRGAVNPELDWKITLPLGASGFLTLTRPGHEKAPKLMISTLDRLQDALRARDRLASTSSIAVVPTTRRPRVFRKTA